MPDHLYRHVAISGVHNTRCARVLDGATSLSLSCEAVMAVVAATGIDLASVDGVAGPLAPAVVYQLGLGPVWTATGSGIALLGHVLNAVAAGIVRTVVIVDAAAGVYTDRGATAPWTRPDNEFTAPFGLFTAAEFALIARRHMEIYGTRPEELAAVAATIRNNGHVNPDAAYYGRGPYTTDDVLNSRMVADPYHLLDCCITSEGGCALVVTTAARAADLAPKPVYVGGLGADLLGPAYEHPPVWDLRGSVGSRTDPAGLIGRRAARSAFAMAGLTPSDVDVCEFYDNFSFEVIRQYEVFGFCGEGEGGDFVLNGTIEPGGRFPVATDGGLLSFNHSGTAQALQRVVRGVNQLRGACATNQVPAAEVAMCSANGSAALRMEVLLLVGEPL